MTENTSTGFHLQANGIRFHCQIDGREGTPWLVFSNSLSTNLSLWDGQVAAFGNSFRILRYDQRGHGGTEVPREPCAYEQLVDDVVALFDALAIQRATFVGVSMGAVTALRLAARNSGRVDRIVACDGQWVNRTGAKELGEQRIAVARKQGMEGLVESTVRRWFRAEFIAGNPPVLEKVRRMVTTTPAEGFIACNSTTTVSVCSGFTSLRCYWSERLTANCRRPCGRCTKRCPDRISSRYRMPATSRTLRIPRSLMQRSRNSFAELQGTRAAQNQHSFKLN